MTWAGGAVGEGCCVVVLVVTGVWLSVHYCGVGNKENAVMIGGGGACAGDGGAN